MTKKEIVELEDKLDERFRNEIVKRKGLHKGVIKEAFEEAIELWLTTDEKLRKEGKEIAKKK